jgi:chromosome segregation ATPase
MEFEQIVKRLEFLDKQQRENKEALAALSERLNSFETSVNAVSKQIKTLSKQITDMTPITRRVDQYEAMLGKQRTDIIKLIEENDKTHTRVEKELTKQHQPELAEINKTLIQLKTTSTTAIQEIKKQLKERTDEIQRMLTNVSDFKSHVDQATRSNEDVLHALKAMEETRKNDLKHITDIQGELVAIRKRVDENRDKYTMTADSMRNVENRFKDLLASEQERKQAQAAFFEQQAMAQLDRDRAWKEWKERSESFQKESVNLDSQIQKLDEALRGAKKAQDTYLELNTKLERRINEVTEMQRLAEDRLRQEWISFKVDDQKRWTGYSLSNEESFRDIRKDLKKTEERIAPLNDATQVLQDQMHQVTDATEKELQEIMNVVHEWMTSYQRIMGHGKKPTNTK